MGTKKLSVLPEPVPEVTTTLCLPSVEKEYLLLESNPRLQGSSVAALGLGINLPIRSLRDDIEIHSSINSRSSGISFFKYYQEVFHDNQLSN